MTIRQMQYFIEVCKNKSVTKAAEILHVAQPSISSSIKDLEAEIGVSLFRRHNKKLHLTKSGELVLGKMEPLLNSFLEMQEDFKSFASNNRNISLGLPLLVGAYLMPKILNNFYTNHKDINVEIVEIGGIDIIPLILSEEIDVAITALGEHFNSNLNYTSLFVSEYCLCVHKSHPLANKSSVCINDFKSLPLVSLKNDFYITKLISGLYAQNNIDPNIVLYTNQMHTIKSLINNNIASAFLLRETVANDCDIVAISLDEKLVANMCIVTKNNRNLSSEVQILIKFLNDEISNIN